MRLFRFFISAMLFIVMLVVLVPILLLTLAPFLYFLLYGMVHKALQPDILRWENIIEFNPDIGWIPKPNLDAFYLDKIGDKCSIITDSEGWGGRFPISEADIVIVGDSFAFGYGAIHEKSYAFVNPDVKVKPIAAPGYNMVQGMLLIKKYAAKLEGKDVGWFICLENDLYDNMLPYHSTSYSTPFVKKAKGDCSWRVIKDHISDSAGNAVMSEQRKYLDFYAKLGSKNVISDRAFSAARYLVDRTAQVCNDYNISLHVIGIPYKDHLEKKELSVSSNGQENFNKNYIDSQFIKICESNEVPYYSMLNWLSGDDYKKYDTHWNEKGNKRVANFLKGLTGKHKEI